MMNGIALSTAAAKGDPEKPRPEFAERAGFEPAAGF
jgi:hypothetical protein